MRKIRNSALELAVPAAMDSPGFYAAGSKKEIRSRLKRPLVAARNADHSTSTALRISLELHRPGDRARIRAAARRKAEAAAWIESVKRRRGK